VTVMTAAGILKTISVVTASLTAMSGMAMTPARVYGPSDSVTRVGPAERDCNRKGEITASGPAYRGNQ
jgi:hypothetical protein